MEFFKKVWLPVMLWVCGFAATPWVMMLSIRYIQWAVDTLAK